MDSASSPVFHGAWRQQQRDCELADRQNCDINFYEPFDDNDIKRGCSVDRNSSSQSAWPSDWLRVSGASRSLIGSSKTVQCLSATGRLARDGYCCCWLQTINPFNASCFKLPLYEGCSAILVQPTIFNFYMRELWRSVLSARMSKIKNSGLDQNGKV